MCIYGNALLVYNPNARSAGEMLGTAAGILSPGIRKLTLMPTQEPGDTERICRELGASYELVVLLGGDGTVHEGVNGLAGLEKRPIVGIIPGGTCNDFARSLRIPIDPVQAAQAILDCRTAKIDLGQAGERYFSNFFGIGLITETSENINPELKGVFGKLSYFLSTLQKVTNASTFRFRLEMEQGTADGEAVMIFAANGRSIGTNVLPTPTDSLEDGMLDIFVIREAGIPLLVEILTQKATQTWDPDKSKIDYYRANRFRLTTDEPMRADTDGEIYLETPIDVSVESELITFAVGK
ncbi:diacylglycerol/lipid kinase family protein [Paenibacillus gansuensis]|uniref:Diacylglycerol/lipid kinase family protein n=1 Tax=Paenibacillus gansuensis TaxID=306542 RepID=A0ABW5PM02_9BACL